MTQAIPDMLHPDEYPQDDQPKSKSNVMMRVEVEEHQRLYALYYDLYMFCAGTMSAEQTRDRIKASFAGLNTYYDGRDMRSVKRIGRPKKGTKSKAVLQ